MQDALKKSLKTSRCGWKDLIRSLGGWSKIISARRHGDRGLADDRILGGHDFVVQIINETEERMK